MFAAAKPFRLDCFDVELASRMPPADWRRMLELRSHSRFLLGLECYDTRIAQFFSDNLILNKVVTEAWRFEMIVYLLYLYETREHDVARSGLTVSNLQKLCTKQNCASNGRVLAILGLMGAAGYLRRSRSVHDNRIMQLEPSEAFINIVEGWNRRIFETIDSIVPEGALESHHVFHPRFGCEMRTRGALGVIEGFKLIDPFPEVSHFVSCDGGWMLLLKCVAETVRHGGGHTIVPVSLDLGAVATRFGVSRSHLRRLLESAYSIGLLDAPPRNGANIMLSPILMASFLSCMASELSYYREHAEAAKREVFADANPTTRQL